MLRYSPPSLLFFFFFNDTATTEIYTLSLHDALPISCRSRARCCCSPRPRSSSRRSGRSRWRPPRRSASPRPSSRSEEHTSELQSRQYLVCRLLLEKKKNQQAASAHTRRSTHSLIQSR